MPVLDAVACTAAIAATHHGAATVAELVNAGVDYDYVRRLVRSGVLVDAAPESSRSRPSLPRRDSDCGW